MSSSLNTIGGLVDTSYPIYLVPCLGDAKMKCLEYEDRGAGLRSHLTPKPLHAARPPATPAPASCTGPKKGGGVDWDYVATIQKIMEDDDDEEMQEEEEEYEEEMSDSGYIGAKGPMIRTSLEWIQWMHKHPPAWVCETYLNMNKEKNEEMDRMAGELILLKKYTDDVDEENMRLRLSGPGPKEHKEEVEKFSNNNPSRTSAWSISTTTPSPTSLKTELDSRKHYKEAYLFFLADTRLPWSLR